MKKIICAIAISLIVCGCKSSKGCGCPSPYGYIDTHSSTKYLAQK